MMRCRRDRLCFIRVEDDDVGIPADGNRAFAREQTEEFGGGGRSQFDEAVDADAAAYHAAIVDQAHAVLDTGAAIGNLREVVEAEFFLLFETERAVIRRD